MADWLICDGWINPLTSLDRRRLEAFHAARSRGAGCQMSSVDRKVTNLQRIQRACYTSGYVSISKTCAESGYSSVSR